MFRLLGAKPTLVYVFHEMRGKSGKSEGRGLRRSTSNHLVFGTVVIIAFFHLAASQALANGTVTVSVGGAGAGHVGSVSQTIFFGSPFGAATTTPGEIDCDKSGGPVCAMSVAATAGSEARVTLTATPAPGQQFVAWKQEGATGVVSGCDTTAACVINLNGTPGPGATVTATFACSPTVPAPGAITGAARAGVNTWLRRLEGEVDPKGCALDRSFFEYGPTTAYGSVTTTSDPGEGAGSVPVSAETEPLEPNTTYHYRLVAVGPGGTSGGEDRTFTTDPAPVGSCPNETRRLEQGIMSLLLPDCMALEMVSPSQKAGKPAYFPNVSLDGSRVAFLSPAALGENPSAPLNLLGSIYVAGRGDAGWTTDRIQPAAALRVLWSTAGGGSSSPAAIASFTPDFSRGLWIGATGSQWEEGIGEAYESSLGGSFRRLSAPLVPLTSGSAKRNIIIGTEFQAASADHSHLYFRPGSGGGQTTYLPDDPSLSGPGNEAVNTYLVRVDPDGQRAVELLQRGRDGKSGHDGKIWGGECGARLGGIGAANSANPAPNGDRNQGAVSTGGRRTYLSARESQPAGEACDQSAHKLRILERLETTSGPLIAPLFSSECDRPPGEPCSDADGDDLYQGASLDQSKVYFTTNRQLADSDRDGSSKECDEHFFGQPVAVLGCDLYLYDRARPAGERLIQVSAGGVGDPTPGEGARVYNGITGISADGSRAYFVATGVLTEDENPEEESATANQPNLYMFDERAWEEEGEEGGLTFIGRLHADDGIKLSADRYSEGLWGGQGTWKNNAYPVPVLSDAERRGEGDAEEGGDGHILVFESHASLTENDADGGRLDVYRYDADARTLECVSCAAGSSEAVPDEAPFDVAARGDMGSLGTDFAERQRWVSEDGEMIVFRTAQSLVPGDSNGITDHYLWRSGQLYRLTRSGAFQFGGSRGAPVVSPDGATVAFGSATPLLSADGDTAEDIYVARASGGFPNPPAPSPCVPGSDCQAEPTPPAPPQSTSETPTQGNVKPRRCAAPTRRARAASKRARKLRKRARRASRHNIQRAAVLRRQAGRAGKRAKRLGKRAKRCRAGKALSPEANAKRSAHRHGHRRVAR